MKLKAKITITVTAVIGVPLAIVLGVCCYILLPVSGEDYAIYSDFLGQYPDKIHNFSNEDYPLLISDHTNTGVTAFPLSAWVTSPLTAPQSPIVAREMAMRRSVSKKLSRRFLIGGPYKLVPVTGFALQPREEREHGLFTFSDVTYGAGGSEAHFYFEHLCDLCGGGALVTMKRVGNGWIVIREDWLWES
jgi:hypothetical protein